MKSDIISLHKKWSFPWRVSLVNVAKSAVFWGCGHIYWKNPYWKTSFFVQYLVCLFISSKCLRKQYLMEKLKIDSYIMVFFPGEIYFKCFYLRRATIVGKGFSTYFSLPPCSMLTKKFGCNGVLQESLKNTDTLHWVQGEGRLEHFYSTT